MAETEPIDPDIESSFNGKPTRRLPPLGGNVLVAISLGGAFGAAARYLLSRWWPAATGDFPWTTFYINVSGSALLALVVVTATRVWPDRKLLGPFLGTGVLGGFTTFSTFALEQRQLITDSDLLLAFSYTAATMLSCLAATFVVLRLARMATAGLR